MDPEPSVVPEASVVPTDGVDTNAVGSANNASTVMPQESQATLGVQTAWEEEAASAAAAPAPKAPPGPSPVRRPKLAQPTAVDSAQSDARRPPTISTSEP